MIQRMLPRGIFLFILAVLAALDRFRRLRSSNSHRAELRKQIEYYFSDINYARDVGLQRIAAENNGGMLAVLCVNFEPASLQTLLTQRSPCQ
jgi:hypothetical protein